MLYAVLVAHAFIDLGNFAHFHPPVLIVAWREARAASDK